MNELKVVGVENGKLVATSDDGDEFRIAVDDGLQSRLRQCTAESDLGPRVPPREIQAYIRSGMSAEDVSTVTGASVDYIRRFEGPVVAEREHIIGSALSVAVETSIDPDPIGEETTFGSVIRERLTSLSAVGERWASWKEPSSGWVVKLSFTVDGIDHDARWSYDQKKGTLKPLNNEATSLSQQGEVHGVLIPRLRAVRPETEERDSSRFDSGAFVLDEPLSASPEANVDTRYPEPVPMGSRGTAHPSSAASLAAIKRAEEPATPAPTADLLEALRRRRDEQAAIATPVTHDERTPHPSVPSAPRGLHAASGGAMPKGPRKGRAHMPSWDEIVFGARTDDDLA
jgi:Protein of unknown function (DUF3071)